jgi:hypothetical protein
MIVNYEIVDDDSEDRVFIDSDKFNWEKSEEAKGNKLEETLVESEMELQPFDYKQREIKIDSKTEVVSVPIAPLSCRHCKDSTPRLIVPCRCDSDKKYAHADCVMKWIYSHSFQGLQTRCSTCLQRFHLTIERKQNFFGFVLLCVMKHVFQWAWTAFFFWFSFFMFDKQFIPNQGLQYVMFLLIFLIGHALCWLYLLLRAHKQLQDVYCQLFLSSSFGGFILFAVTGLFIGIIFLEISSTGYKITEAKQYEPDSNSVIIL